MPYPLPLTRTEAYLAYKAGVIQQPDLKPSLAKPRIGIDDWLAYWTGLKNDYPKNPDGTPKMLQEEEKYIAYLCGVTDTYPEKCLRRVGAYLRYLISARWGRPDHPFNREELYLSLIKTQFIPSGDPSSDIEIDGTAKAAFVDVKMYGDTYQQANPNPDYPQPIQTVTGLQTISINGTDYLIDLGSIELCKLGTYQDYIYKSGDDWKVHKATATLTLNGGSSENWYIDQYAYMLNGVISAKSFSDIANMEAYCKSFSKSATGQVSSYVVSFWYNAPGTGVRFIKDQTPDISSFRNWLASNNQTVYYPLATATDTAITDTNLIAQLEALVNGGAENGTTYIKVSATDPNLPGLLYVEAPKYE